MSAIGVAAIGGIDAVLAAIALWPDNACIAVKASVASKMRTIRVINVTPSTSNERNNLSGGPFGSMKETSSPCSAYPALILGSGRDKRKDTVL